MRLPHVPLGVAVLSAFLALPLAADAEAGFKEVSPDQVEKMLGAPDVRVYDVNDASMFAKYHVPGAIHLGSQKLESVLPSDKATRLVFYCSNTLWTASHQAARVAARNGYTNVFVMTEGIKGWVTAGKKYDTGGA